MQSPIDVIKGYGIPTDSYVGACQYVMNDDAEYHRPGMGLLTKEEYEEHICEIIGLTAVPRYDNLKTARVYFGYTVQETIRAFANGDIPLMEDVWEKVNALATNFCETNPWSVKDYVAEDDGEPKLDAAGNPKQKKGAKKEMARKVWNENKHKEMTRKEWIALLCEEVGLTAAGASTYYANLRKNKM